MSRSLFASLHRRYGERLSGAERQQRLRIRLDAFNDESFKPTDPRARVDSSLRKRVIVVGGGFAGLNAAWTLAGNTDVTVLEARDRVGGRVHSLVNGATKRITEAGGELIGYAHPTWLTLAQRFNLALVVWTSDGDFDALSLDMPTYVDGRLLSPSATETIYDEMNLVFAKMSRDAQLIKDPQRPWIGEHANAFDQQPLSRWIADHSSSPLMRKALEIQFANTNGAPSTHQSYLANLALIAGAARHGKPDDFFTMSENVRCAEGNESLARALAVDIEKRGGKIQLSSPVSKIQILADGLSVTPEGGKPIAADFVVLAIPPSVWPSPTSKLVIDSPIPADYYMSMGTVVKYLSRSSTRFWLEEGRAPSGASDQCGMVWEGTDNQMQTPDQDVELSLFAGGEAANAAIDAFRRAGQGGVQQFYDDQITKMYATYTQQRDPGTVFVNWPLEPWTMGGYSCPAPGDVCTVGPKLVEPFQERLYFAGEHTCLPFFGYMEGALQSGTRAAQAILRM
jgi:monoamine oxidase